MAADLPIRFAQADLCPDAAKHTPTPAGYVDRAVWMGKMTKTHVQEQCPTCGFWAIWRKRGR